jgi:hypothetical protein
LNPFVTYSTKDTNDSAGEAQIVTLLLQSNKTFENMLSCPHVGKKTSHCKGEKNDHHSEPAEQYDEF